VASKSKRERLAPKKNPSKSFLYWTISVFALKLIVLLNIQGGNIEISGRPFFLDNIWLGADGENYVTGFDALSREGVFSEAAILNYWPAGYPLFLLFLSIFGKSWVFASLAIVQSAIFSWATFSFAKQLSRTRLKNFSYLIFLLILLNPTLSLSSLAVGYESLAASGFLLSLAIIVQDLIEKNESRFKWRLITVSAIFGFLTFIQTGGYNSKDKGVDCNVENRTDNDLVMCVLRWYLENPSKSLQLFYNKSIYFWSPWFGPEANGTMARNPWLKISPVKNITSTQEGIDLVYGGFGKLISWIWLLSGIALLLYGFRFLWQQKSLERFIATMVMVIILTNWLISLISIGDHRFRIPIMGMSLFLQAIGIKVLFKGKKPLMVDGPALR